MQLELKLHQGMKTSTWYSMLNGDEDFLYVIPLLHIFRFCRNVRKVIFGAKHTVVLVRKGTDNDAIWHVEGADDNATAALHGKVVLTKLSLWMPVMTPTISEVKVVNQRYHG